MDTEQQLEQMAESAAKTFNLDRNKTLTLLNLMRIHGPSRLSRERNGVHAYFPSPKALELDGKIEIHKKHLSLNLSKLSNPDQYIALCHKYDIRYSVTQLLQMLPIERRCNISVKRIVNTFDSKNNLIHDDEGNVIHEPAGETIPLHKLPEDHAAIEYVKSRKGGGFIPELLYEQFRASYCTKHAGLRKYNIMEGNFDNSPAGRIVFFIDILGKERGWQARIPEMKRDDFIYYWNVHHNAWVPTYVKSSYLVDNKVDKKFIDFKKNTGEMRPLSLLPPYRYDTKFTIPKYIISLGCNRNEVVMGYDSAVKLAEKNNKKDLFIVEGPMDAARLYHAGFPSVALMGKYTSSNQINLLRRYFRNFYVVGDSDEAGKVMAESLVSSFLDYKIIVNKITIPSDYKDVAEMTTDETRILINKYI